MCHNTSLQTMFQVITKQDGGRKHLQKEKCKLVPEGFILQEHIDQIAMLADDDQVELKELQPGTCSDNFSRVGNNSSSSSCKGSFYLVVK